MKFNTIDFKKDPILSIINLSLYIVLIIVIYFLLLKILGHSPIFETIIATLLIGMIINLFRYEHALGKFIGETTEFRKNIKESFHNIKQDIKEIKQELKGGENETK